MIIDWVKLITYVCIFFGTIYIWFIIISKLVGS